MKSEQTVCITIKENVKLKIEAESYSSKSGKVGDISNSSCSGGKGIGWIYPGDYTAYNVDFEDRGRPSKITFRYSAGNNKDGKKLKITVRLGTSDGEILAETYLPDTSSGVFDSYTVDLDYEKFTDNAQTICLCFGEGEEQGAGADIDYFELSDWK